MPRISPKDFLRARAISNALVSLLPACRDLRSAQNELRWMQQHAIKVSQRARVDHHHVLNSYVARRAQGEPLQYILGSEYFGGLEIRCRPGVLIPRPETAASVSCFVKRLKNDRQYVLPSPLRVLDLCTGSGCIPLLFHHEFYARSPGADTSLELVGVDVSSDALSLARENLIHQMAQHTESPSSSPQQNKSLNSIGFVQADILNNDADVEDQPLSLSQALDRLRDGSNRPIFDILISNPPYISPSGFQRTTSRSVRQYEPRLALVPPGPPSGDDEAIGDLFYPRLLHIAEQIEAKMFLFEVADMDQAKRVATMASVQKVWSKIEIWRDEPDIALSEEMQIQGQTINVRGRGHGRSVFAYRDEAVDWLE
ncbi:hypothetical protein M409DRAFT_65589 [Zasmidium cellare ATCC 36951]|uniref:Uncharacterized protein n=1 Tax=Zasmidium cellare ATCC 36951 TaxID=1080233 RepID=A0A6A6CPI2_ZASCE|nr:uncharacterized protein M409DRAFT_65589 [Zasmidium cellare ATCC 36951]KAF2168040.1 hypothetical protein M409DRAFT_65589 [Zasmidium cellare ATCC 36951]